MSQEEEEAARARADLWLWRARFFKTRADAAAACKSGAVRRWRGDKASLLDKPGDRIAVNDLLTIACGRGLVSVRVLALGVRRGPPAQARALFCSAGDESMAFEID